MKKADVYNQLAIIDRKFENTLRTIKIRLRDMRSSGRDISELLSEFNRINNMFRDTIDELYFLLDETRRITKGLSIEIEEMLETLSYAHDLATEFKGQLT